MFNTYILLRSSKFYFMHIKTSHIFTFFTQDTLDSKFVQLPFVNSIKGYSVNLLEH